MLRELLQVAAVTAVGTAVAIIVVKTMNGEIKWEWGYSKEDPVAQEGDEIPGNKNQRDKRWTKH